MILKIGFMAFIYLMPIWVILIYTIMDKFNFFEQFKQESEQKEEVWSERNAA